MRIFKIKTDFHTCSDKMLLCLINRYLFFSFPTALLCKREVDKKNLLSKRDLRDSTDDGHVLAARPPKRKRPARKIWKKRLDWTRKKLGLTEKKSDWTEKKTFKLSLRCSSGEEGDDESEYRCNRVFYNHRRCETDSLKIENYFLQKCFV